jgi:hypothetical protein
MVPGLCVEVNSWIFVLYQWSRNAFVYLYIAKNHVEFIKFSVFLLPQQESGAI